MYEDYRKVQNILKNQEINVNLPYLVVLLNSILIWNAVYQGVDGNSIRLYDILFACYLVSGSAFTTAQLLFCV